MWIIQINKHSGAKSIKQEYTFMIPSYKSNLLNFRAFEVMEGIKTTLYLSKYKLY